MPWELGFFDGLKSRVAVFPLVQIATAAYDGREYLSLYPYVTYEETNAIPPTHTMWINSAPRTYVALKAWLSGKQPTTRR